MSISTDDRLELALQASNEGIWVWDVLAHEVRYTERVLEFLGTPKGDPPNLFSQPDLYFHEDDLEVFKEGVGAVLRRDGEEYLSVDCRYRRPEGYFSWLRIRGACVRDEGGNVLRIAGSMIDISRRKNAERALSDERYLLNKLIENIPNNIYFKDRESRFVMVNQATVVKMGLTRAEEILGKTDHDFFDVTHADKSRADEVKIMETLERQEESLERETWENGEDTWVLTTKIPWLDGKGKVKGIFGVTSDVSDMVNVQIRLSNAASELRSRNEEYQEEIELARQVQQAVLDPRPASFPRGGTGCGYRTVFSTYYKPDSEMGGDFYEVLPISKNKVGVLICDVMGHGVRAALVVAMLRGLMEQNSEFMDKPGVFLGALNESLVKIFSHAGIQMFATALYMVIDVESGVFAVASAGHPLPLVVQSGSVSVMEFDKKLKGPALGLMDGVSYGESAEDLSAVEQLILYTDGIYEVENAEGEQLGVAKICGCLAEKYEGGGGDSTLKMLLECAQEHAGNDSYGDDVTLLAVDVAAQHFQI